MTSQPARFLTVSACLAAALATGCISPPASKRVPTAAQTSKVGRPDAAPLLSEGGIGILSNNGGGLVSNNGGGLLGEDDIGADDGLGVCSGTVVAPCSPRPTPTPPGPIAAAEAGVLAQPGAALAGHCALPSTGAAGVSLALVTLDGRPVLAPGGTTPLACVPDAKGAFRFEGIGLQRELVVVATLGHEKGELLALATPDGVSRCDLPSTFAVMEVALLSRGEPDHPPLPLQVFSAFVDALAGVPVDRLEALGVRRNLVFDGIQELAKTYPAVAKAEDAVFRVLVPRVEASPSDGPS